MEYIDNIKEPQIGEIVAVEIADILSVCITNTNNIDYDMNEFQHGFYLEEDFIYNSLGAEIYDSGYITLLKYIGKGQFIEMYSLRPINFGHTSHLDGDKDYSVFHKSRNFLNKYEFFDNAENFMENAYNFLDNPLFVSRWGIINNDIKKKIGEQESKKEEITNIMNLAYTKASDRIKQDLNKLMNQDIEYAYGENVIYDFKNNLK